MALDKIDLLVLKALSPEPLHGYGVSQRITQLSGGDLRITLGSLYPALQRLERSGLVAAEWRASDHNRRARYYALTPLGRRRLASGQKAWQRSIAAVLRVLEA
jgi:PadR family transcriptional regulator, regulatory protein PadR